ncbi:Palmitoyl-protein thioesterase 1 [Smittium mucronatum]|uniref:Palmitoyl-protein thioesterase 1 n=1 Tax=Smittium mucronatum TaxID=133383 RepID=A0A1R0GXE6_9FUNG|nr:Palmitoyl-protein thioesterase 1 [Smittium mucronatum]
MWHMLGDDCCSDFSNNFIKNIKSVIPNAYVYSVKVGITPAGDRINGYFGNSKIQVDLICQQLKSNPALANGYNGLGFSQGGLLMRALLQRCPYPKMNSLVTFGSPHAGVSSPPCKDALGSFCNSVSKSINSGVYKPLIQNAIVPAQYYKDPKNINEYLKKSILLPDINNEIKDYVNRIKQLKKFVMVKFSQEQIVKPALSTVRYISNSDIIALLNTMSIPLKIHEGPY